MEQIAKIVAECIAHAASPSERKENRWLNEKYGSFMQQNGIRRKSEADRILCERIFGPDVSDSAEQKIRYWRSGKHLPSDRDIARKFGMALELKQEDMKTLLCGWMDIREVAFSEEELSDTVYIAQKAVIDRLVEEYIIKVCLRDRQMPMTENQVRNNLRHHYYMDARNLTSLKAEDRDKVPHFQSMYYNSEFYRSLSLQGEIPRKTMLRHIFVLGMPYLSRQVVSEILESLGYLPLEEDHLTTAGQALDLLVIRLLELYEKTCDGQSADSCSRWLTHTLREMDRLLAGQKQEGLRFMKFKSLK